MSKRKRRFTQDFKLQALSRMETAETITLLAVELGVRREMLHKWRRAHEEGGIGALQPIGRPPVASKLLADDALAPSVRPSARPDGGGAEPRRIAELQRLIGQQQQDLDFFRAALRHVREQHPKKGEPGATASTR